MTIADLPMLTAIRAKMRRHAARRKPFARNADADPTARAPDGACYRRRIPPFRAAFDREAEVRVVTLGAVRADATDFERRYEPGHPAADAAGYVRVPNVNPLIEAVDMREAQRFRAAKRDGVAAARRMIRRTLDLLRA
jgi:flagellar basal-body rod protein FlgC